MSVALITISPLAIVAQYGVVPPMLHISGLGDVHGADVGWTSGNYQLVNITMAGTSPDPFATVSGTSLSLAGNTLTITTSYNAGAPTTVQLKSYAREKRQMKMSGGTTVSGVAVATDAGTLALISMAYTKALATPGFTMPWNNAGTWITLNATSIQAAAQAVGVFLAGCLASEATANSGITGGTITTAAQVDALF